MAKLDKGKLTIFRPQKDNANRHTERGLRMLSDAYNKVGYVAPMTAAADGEIIDGSARLETAFDQFGDEAIVIHHDGRRPVIMVHDDIPNADTPEAKAISYAANRIAQVDLDFDPAVILADINAGVDLGQWWNEDELAAIIGDLAGEGAGGDTEPEIDRAAELAKEWGTAVGQCWELGPHRLAVGDCTDAAVVEAVMRGERAALVSDPPYGISVDTSWLSALNMQRGKPANMSDDKLANDDGSLDLSFVYEYAEWLVFGFPYIARDKGYTGLLVWDKRGDGGEGGLGNPVEVAASNAFNGYRLKRHVWAGYVREAGEKREPHPTQKPVGIIQDAIELVKNKTILDPFVGSGTTIIAAHNLGRIARAIELDPGYSAVTLQRYRDHTGQEPRQR